MSIDAMTDRAINARFKEVPITFVPTELVSRAAFAQAYDVHFTTRGEAGSSTSFTGQTNASSTTTGSALSAIVAYIPTEVVTTYVAVIAALGSIATQSSLERWVTFWVFLGFTPIATWVIFAVKLKSRGVLNQLSSLKRWPWWELFSASLAFSVWAYALPASPFSGFSWYKPGLGTAGLLVVSFLLAMFAPLFQPKSA